MVLEIVLTCLNMDFYLLQLQQVYFHLPNYVALHLTILLIICQMSTEMENQILLSAPVMRVCQPFEKQQ